ncbi:toll/interleukin-1 receptor domain-containing protein [Acinetobacter nematophilus]|uniref:Toll/interleukin-1 receptor domain-containing protein n=1 Tax=Acinetobacter nematophilus TaxID=2994642 RepID=A0A9X3IGM9_9GAMM|nr:toll/interleukin-1 receptor domain-containing protein [Acinetobacter nematophilus]MCX5467902.1 toll/interleukin-1 receptor domain-containing protein [Acinetobacter nematophilus]
MTELNDDIPPKVFISYSHDSEEHKHWVIQLATRLRSNGVDVILDTWNTKLGSDLACFMEQGLSQSQRIICICSDNYLLKANNGKGGAGYEKQIMTAELIIDQNTDWIIPLVINNSSDKKTPTFLGGRKYINFEDPKLYEIRYEELLRDILNVPVLPIPPIGKNPFKVIKEFSQQKFLPTNEKYVSPSVFGKITFDYSNNNGCYFIGQDELAFEINFSKASNKSIYLYNDPSNIKTLAIAKGINKITDIVDARSYDTSSRTRCPKVNEIVILQNLNGFYAAIKILSIKDDSRGDECDEVTFEYFIQTNGSPNFLHE